MQPLRLFPQPNLATRTSPVRHGKRGLGAAEEGRERPAELSKGLDPPPALALQQEGAHSCLSLQLSR